MTSSINKRIIKYLHKHCLNGDKIDGLDCLGLRSEKITILFISVKDKFQLLQFYID